MEIVARMNARVETRETPKAIARAFHTGLKNVYQIVARYQYLGLKTKSQGFFRYRPGSQFTKSRLVDKTNL